MNGAKPAEVPADPIERILASRGYLDIVDSRQLNNGKRGDTCHAPEVFTTFKI